MIFFQSLKKTVLWSRFINRRLKMPVITTLDICLFVFFSGWVASASDSTEYCSSPTRSRLRAITQPHFYLILEKLKFYIFSLLINVGQVVWMKMRGKLPPMRMCGVSEYCDGLFIHFIITVKLITCWKLIVDSSRIFTCTQSFLGGLFSYTKSFLYCEKFISSFEGQNYSILRKYNSFLLFI